MISWDSKLLEISKTTDTTIKIPVPPKVKVEIPVKFVANDGKTAIAPRNKPPAKVIRFKT